MGTQSLKILTVYVQPGAKETRLVGLHDGLPKLAVKARPVDGAANAALLSFLADLTGCSPSSLTLVAGSRSRTKRIVMSDEAHAGLEALIAELQDCACLAMPCLGIKQVTQA
ncbi:MAG: DUF167 domain-containing protein [Betaproteobacteria bacterium]